MDVYEWDDAKNEANKLKHGIGFEAIEGFDWSSANHAGRRPLRLW